MKWNWKKNVGVGIKEKTQEVKRWKSGDEGSEWKEWMKTKTFHFSSI